MFVLSLSQLDFFEEVAYFVFCLSTNQNEDKVFSVHLVSMQRKLQLVFSIYTIKESFTGKREKLNKI